MPDHEEANRRWRDWVHYLSTCPRLPPHYYNDRRAATPSCNPGTCIPCDEYRAKWAESERLRDLYRQAAGFPA